MCMYTYACVHAYIHTYIHTHIHTCIQSSMDNRLMLFGLYMVNGGHLFGLWWAFMTLPEAARRFVCVATGTVYPVCVCVVCVCVRGVRAGVRVCVCVCMRACVLCVRACVCVDF